MSMKSWTIRGYGVNVTNLKYDIDKMAKFLKKYLPDEFEDFEFEDETSKEIVEVFDYNYENDCGDTGVWAAVNDVINKFDESQITFSYLHCGDVSPVKAIVFAELLPWEFTEAEKKATPETIGAILAKWFKKFCVDNVEIDFHEVEYYG